MYIYIHTHVYIYPAGGGGGGGAPARMFIVRETRGGTCGCIRRYMYDNYLCVYTPDKGMFAGESKDVSLSVTI